jgi:hypothetical protein
VIGGMRGRGLEAHHDGDDQAGDGEQGGDQERLRHCGAL